MATQSCLDCEKPVSLGAYHCPNCRRLTSHGSSIFLMRVTFLALIAWNLFAYQPF